MGFKESFIDTNRYLVYSQNQQAIYAADPDTAYSAGGSKPQTADITLWNMAEGATASHVTAAIYFAGGTPNDPETETLDIEQVTTSFQTATIYGIKIKDAPVGRLIGLTPATGYGVENVGFAYQESTAFPPANLPSGAVVLMPINGLVQMGSYSAVSNGN